MLIWQSPTSLSSPVPPLSARVRRAKTSELISPSSNEVNETVPGGRIFSAAFFVLRVAFFSLRVYLKRDHGFYSTVKKGKIL